MTACAAAKPAATATDASATSTDSAADTAKAAEVVDTASATDTPPGADTAGQAETTGADPYGNPDCDPLQPLTCALPFPSSKFLVADPASATGWRLKFGATTLPKNSSGQPVGKDAWERLDGFSVGTSLLVQFPNVDIAAMAQQKTIEKSVDKASQTVWLELNKDGSVKRHIPHFVELDQRDNAPTGVDPATQVLFVRPGVILEYGTRYVVAFRNVADTKGKKLARSPAFEALAAGKTAGTQLAGRQVRFDEIFAALAKEGIAKDELTLAWDFVTYSNQAIHGTMLSMRDKALAAIGPDGAQLTISSFAAKKDGGTEDPNIAHTLRGTFKAPNFMKDVVIAGTAGDPKAIVCRRWNMNDKGELVQNGWREAQLWIRIPHAAMDGTPHDLLHYGHGLNGSGNETYSSWAGPNANTRKFIYIANSMIGMSNEDDDMILQILQDLSLFPCLTERVTAGVVEHLVLERTLKDHGTALLSKALTDFLKKDTKIVTTGKVFWSGNSQGGIYGQTVTAVSQDIVRAHLGQAGLDYSLLLERSVDFADFSGLLSAYYPNRNEYAFLLSYMQLLWDYVDPVTHTRHIEFDPLPNTPTHEALVVVHPGDFQVDAMTMEIAARSGYFKLLPFYGKAVPLVAESAYPVKGSAMVAIDFGNTWSIKGNLPPGPELGYECGDPNLPQADGPCLGKALCDPKGTFKACTLDDPHDRAHGLKAHNDQMRWFFDTGEVKDFCGGDGCKPE